MTLVYKYTIDIDRILFDLRIDMAYILPLHALPSSQHLPICCISSMTTLSMAFRCVRAIPRPLVGGLDPLK